MHTLYFVIVCGLLKWKRMCRFFFRLFIYALPLKILSMKVIIRNCEHQFQVKVYTSMFSLDNTIHHHTSYLHLLVSWKKMSASYKSQELLPFHEHLGSPTVFGRVPDLFSFLSLVCVCVSLFAFVFVCLFFVVAYFVLFLSVFDLCLVYPMVTVSLLLFSSVYLYVL